MKERRNDIDNARAILIGLVVLGHVLNYANPGYTIIPYVLAQEFFDVFEMPAFFLLSGMLTDGEKWRRRPAGAYFARRAQTLLIPYVFFECAAIVYKHFVLRTVTLAEGLRLMLTLRCNVGADWFLPAMFLACALYYLSIRFPNDRLWGAAAAAAMLAGLPWMMSAWGGHLCTLIFRGVLGCCFMIAGHLLQRPLTALTWRRTVCAFFLTAAAAAVCFRFSLGNSFYSGILRSPALYLISGVCGTGFVLGLARRLPWKWPAKIGQNALVIMGTHQLVLYTVPGSSSPLWVLGMLVLIAAVEFPIIYLTNRFCPILIGKRRKEPSHD